MTPLRKAGLVAMTLFPIVIAANEYTYIEGGYVNIDRDRVDDSGGRVAGSANIAPNFNLFSEYADTGDIEQFTAGGQFHAPVSSSLDVIAGASYEALDVGPFDDSGFGLRAGFRWTEPSGQVQLSPEIRHLDVFDTSSTSLRLGVLVPIAPKLGIQGALQGGDDDRFEAGMRYVF